MSDIAVNKSGIAVNKSDSAVNKSDIVVNKSDIAVNESDTVQIRTRGAGIRAILIYTWLCSVPNIYINKYLLYKHNPGARAYPENPNLHAANWRQKLICWWFWPAVLLDEKLKTQINLAQIHKHRKKCDLGRPRFQFLRLFDASWTLAFEKCS